MKIGTEKGTQKRALFFFDARGFDLFGGADFRAATQPRRFGAVVGIQEARDDCLGFGELEIGHGQIRIRHGNDFRFGGELRFHFFFKCVELVLRVVDFIAREERVEADGFRFRSGPIHLRIAFNECAGKFHGLAAFHDHKVVTDVFVFTGETLGRTLRFCRAHRKTGEAVGVDHRRRRGFFLCTGKRGGGKDEKKKNRCWFHASDSACILWLFKLPPTELNTNVVARSHDPHFFLPRRVPADFSEAAARGAVGNAAAAGDTDGRDRRYDLHHATASLAASPLSVCTNLGGGI